MPGSNAYTMFFLAMVATKVRSTVFFLRYIITTLIKTANWNVMSSLKTHVDQLVSMFFHI